jgi:dipeptidyl aminopeptidase/acylaminoacyl peptidase
MSFVFSQFVFAQNKTIDNKDVLETKLGLEKAEMIRHAVANTDTVFKINTDAIINTNDASEPFLFLDGDSKLLFYVQEKHTPVVSKSVDVYSYMDVKLQDQQLRDVDILRKYAVVFDFKTSRLIRLENEGEKLVAHYSTYVNDIQVNDQYVLVYDFGGDIFTYERNGVINETYSMKQYTWNRGLDCTVYLVSLRDGSKITIKKNPIAVLDKFPYFRLSPDGKYVLSYEDHNYYAYNITTGKTNCITKHVSSYFSPAKDFIDYYYPQYSIVEWKEGSKVLVTDVTSDVWELDLSGQKQAVKHAVQKRESKSETDAKIKTKEGTIVTEKINWKAFDGRIGSGVLAKPKDFDPHKKYPIIFTYYEKSILRYNNRMPYGGGDLVDYGYLVFSPDIEYNIGETGNSVFNYVVSAAEYLKKLPYVDSTRMGLRGASFGGYETNYLVTRSNLFAAAISMSGLSNFISNFGAQDIWERPHGLEGNDQNRLGVTMWERPDVWIKNSPLFYADKVSTPILLIGSITDGDVPFEQSMAFFRALRSMGKRSWLLQYDDKGHIGAVSSTIGKGDGSCDFCLRQLQFFNHYLKGDPAPLWMLDGIPAREKGKKTGLELDTLGRTPGPGLRREKLILTSQQEELLKHRTMVTDDGRIIDVGEKKKLKH